VNASGIQTGDDGVLRTRLRLAVARHYLFDGNYTEGCEVTRHGTGTASNSEVAFYVRFGTEEATAPSPLMPRFAALL
jgi:hypothetical protein